MKHLTAGLLLDDHPMPNGPTGRDVVRWWSVYLSTRHPVITGIVCDASANENTLYINRSEWRDLTRFQASNNLMLAMQLPTDNQTVIRYVDDRTGEVLAMFTAHTPGNQITLTHP